MYTQAYKLDVDQDDIQQLESSIAKDILSCELSKAEFAEVLSMGPTSEFVTHMFNLIDKDQSGSVSFREFLDIIVIFAKGMIICLVLSCLVLSCLVLYHIYVFFNI